MFLFKSVLISPFLPLHSSLFSPLLWKSIQEGILGHAAFRPIAQSDSDMQHIHVERTDQLTDKRTVYVSTYTMNRRRCSAQPKVAAEAAQGAKRTLMWIIGASVTATVNE